MAIPYRNIVRAVLLRANQFADGDAAARETSYQGDPEDEITGIEVPYSALKQDILAVEKELAEMIGNSNNAIYRAELEAQSLTPIASGDEIPIVCDRGYFVGAFDSVLDAATGTIPCREMPLQFVLRRNDNPGTFWRATARYYAREGSRLFHTCAAGVYIRGVGWDYDTQSVLFDTTFAVPALKVFSAVSVSHAANTLTLASHGYWTGMKIRFIKGTGGGASLPSPLAENTDYYVIWIDANTIKVAATLDDALTGDFIDLTTAGGSNNTARPVTGAAGGNSPLPAPLELLWVCKVLAQLPQENWFVPEASWYANLVNERQQAVIEGRPALLQLPDMPIKTSAANPIGG